MQEQSTRRCTRCGEEKLVDDFHRRTSRPSGRASHCKDCDSKRTKQYVGANAEKVAQRRRVYRSGRREQTAAQWAAWYEAHQLERSAAESARAAEWRRQHPEEARMLERARHAVRRAIKRGELVRPDSCSACSRGGMVQAAHHSYAPEHWLDVRWLCRPCHARWDAADPKLKLA